ncbi:Flp pilus assembly complex ATPase component TadA [Pseudomonas syringae pv. syringae]|uniref:GspE/PulE family protein n=1 Tax=Pseudomonas syringae TaxID=317 RepID=UPI00200A4A5F|nr:ATPase, T2SS/T4P/T4SS family [Pseudomonas syringae]MCK9759908.1 Flp pilus assembly complex ATPase component TadA [Pseudomonas syringae pv. syringae]MCK9774899.1 Flp pilus assembly complex ATPase component TadA [Pseudomonas syringae pv. syringae]
MIRSIKVFNTLFGVPRVPLKVVDEAAELAKLVATVRKDERIKNKANLPAYRSVNTKGYGVTGNDLSLTAVLDMGNRKATLLVSENALGQKLHFDLRKKVLDDGFALAHERLADVSVIAQLNKAINQEVIETQSSDVRPIVEELLRSSIDEKATDIHLCCRENSGMVLYRIHSRMYPHKSFDVETCVQIASYLYGQMAESRSRSIGTFSIEMKSMSCTIRTTFSGTNYKLRYKFIRMADGWDVIIRILAAETAGRPSKTFRALGYEHSQDENLEHAISRSTGLILISGPTGSGKSTTLKAIMEFDPHRHFRKRYSVEDPVEYKIFGVSQISIQRSDHDNDEDNSQALNGTLRDILRGDPDEVMVGETRDKSTASAVADFVLTGHKAYTSLHTSSAFGSVLRLDRLGLDRHTLADRQFLSALIFQRLLPVLCTACKVPAKDILATKILDALEIKFGINLNSVYCYSKDGCTECRGRGIVGSTVVAEIVLPDKIIRQYIAEGHDDLAELYWRQSRTKPYDDPDMTGKTAFEHGVYKVSQGIIDPRDLEYEFESLARYELVEVSN